MDTPLRHGHRWMQHSWSSDDVLREHLTRWHDVGLADVPQTTEVLNSLHRDLHRSGPFPLISEKTGQIEGEW